MRKTLYERTEMYLEPELLKIAPLFVLKTPRKVDRWAEDADNMGDENFIHSFSENIPPLDADRRKSDGNRMMLSAHHTQLRGEEGRFVRDEDKELYEEMYRRSVERELGLD